MADYKRFHITAHGRRYSAAFSIEDKQVSIISAYGSAQAPVGHKQPQTLAETLFAQIVQDWRPGKPAVG
jgi:hypothetical protein